MREIKDVFITGIVIGLILGFTGSCLVWRNVFDKFMTHTSIIQADWTISLKESPDGGFGMSITHPKYITSKISTWGHKNLVEQQRTTSDALGMWTVIQLMRNFPEIRNQMEKDEHASIKRIK